jgi:hypothetical protein
MEIGADFELDESSIPFHNMLRGDRSIHSPSDKFQSKRNNKPIMKSGTKRSPVGTAHPKKGAGGINSYNSSSNSKKGLNINQPLSARNVSSQRIMSGANSHKQLR